MGDYLSRDEFLRRWEAMPQLKFAELIEGVVYMPSPLSWSHGTRDSEIGAWLAVYRAATPGLESATNATWLMGKDDAPQPDNSLRIRPDYGGQSRNEGEYVAGAPEFLAETCLSSTSYDLHQKLAVYERAGVQEYLAILVHEQQMRWHQLTEGHFLVVPEPADGSYRSSVFPGLWLDARSLLAGDLARVLAVLNEGINSPEHRQFVAQLLGRKQT
jgi:Uma2 family endonuclease